MANYIDRKAFHQLFINVKKNWDQICLDLNLMVQHISTKSKFISPEEKEDFCSAVLCHALRYVGSFKMEKGNAFNYFTSVISNQFKGEFMKQCNKKRLHLEWLKDWAEEHASLSNLQKMGHIEIPDKPVSKKKLEKPVKPIKPEKKQKR